MKRIFILVILLNSTVGLNAQNWDYIKSSGEYYYGESMATTEEEADKGALAQLASMIAVHVSSDFTQNYEHSSNGSKIAHSQYVRNCIQTYSTSTLTNCEKMIFGSKPKVTVRRWMKRCELAMIYESRIAKAKDMVEMANEAVERRKLGMALQYYYWAYSLIRSVQYPNEVTDDDGHLLVNWIIPQMRNIISDIKVYVEYLDGDNVDLIFTYKGEGISEIEFAYNDGREMCTGKAKDGRGTMQMIPNYEGDDYYLEVEYEYKGLARGDAEMESVLNVVNRVAIPEASFSLHNNGNGSKTIAKQSSDIKCEPSISQVVANSTIYDATIKKILSAIKTRKHIDVYNCFTIDGREMFNQLIGYGRGRIVGTPDVHYYKSKNGKVVARGLQMSFSFRNGTKMTFVEDVAFTFNDQGKIENIAFGLGKNTEADILTKKVMWKEETREQLMEFLENYKTAYCLKRLDYIKDIFSDDAIIIVGNVARQYTAQRTGDGKMSIKGRNIITTNRYTKDKYLQNLARCFKNNEFINIRFTHSDIQMLEKNANQEVVCVQLAQDYNSTTYADQGYLFLMIDMTDKDNPFIKVRTWQSEPDPKFGYYNAGDFYDE
ncbi:MAG: hypothetical protein MJY52_00220 [Bacteroidaceae bacterium]|nr:hypothetical protein [Bacteroidaceae bacterium]